MSAKKPVKFQRLLLDYQMTAQWKELGSLIDHLPRPKFSNFWSMQRNFSSEIALGSAEPRILLSTCHSLKSRPIAKKKFYLLSEANDNFANVTV